jgi:hypothetical protein
MSPFPHAVCGVVVVTRAQRQDSGLNEDIYSNQKGRLFITEISGLALAYSPS